MKKHFFTPQIKISLKVTSVIGTIVILFFVVFTFFLRWNLTKQKTQLLNSAYISILDNLSHSDDLLANIFTGDMNGFLQDVPFFINLSFSDKDNYFIFYTNNSSIPLFAETYGKIKHYFSKNYYSDGNLDVFYVTQEIASNLILQVSLDVENDSISKMIVSMPKIIGVMIIPILLMCFFVVLIFLNKDFEKEHTFSANVSHELQTPVNAILGHAKLLQRWGKNDAEQMEKSLEIIIGEAKSMKSTIVNLLEITKLEKGMVSLEKTPLCIESFFDDLKNEFQYEKNLIIETKLLENGPQTILTDQELFHQLFLICISNSLKFCPSPCKITISCFSEKHKTIFEILDNGEGFSKEVLPHIFDRFYRGDSSHSRNKGGAGLGLSIAKSIATALNAKISAKNHPESGAIIRLELGK
ncbi:MAG: HAMP domain-containing histidine kinase [Treponema sp.]|nr:HAMP domain-containing histidine kinase [Treponema sp.]